MLTLIFYVGGSAYGIDCQYVVEVIPSIHLEARPSSRELVAGVIKFYGQSVAVVDFSCLMSKFPCPSCFHTRIAILNLLEDGEQKMLSIGIKGEKMVEVVDIDLSIAFKKGPAFSKMPFLSGIIDIQGRDIQMINVKELFKAMQGAM